MQFKMRFISLSHKYLKGISRGGFPRSFAYAKADLPKFNLFLAQMINRRSPSFFFFYYFAVVGNSFFRNRAFHVLNCLVL